MSSLARVVIVLLAVGPALSASAQTTADQVWAAVVQLGDFDYAVRMEASRAIRRAAPEVAVPVLRSVARGHEDTYVQFRAVVLLHGFLDPCERAFFEDAFELDNDRVRAAAYDYFAHAPDPAIVPKLLAALDRETSEFVRPALVRALAAHGTNVEARARLVSDVDRGEAYFRGAVIEALGDYDADYALDVLLPIAGQAGPLQDDALLAIGKIGDDRALATLQAVQAAASEDMQPIVSATACLLNIDCPAQLQYVTDALEYGARSAQGDSQEFLRSAATGLAALAMRGHRQSLDALVEVGIGAGQTARAPIALALGAVALRNPSLVVETLGDREDLEAALLLLRDSFDMLDEDFAEERFYLLIRGRYWASPDGSRAQQIAELAIQVLEF